MSSGSLGKTLLILTVIFLPFILKQACFAFRPLIHRPD